MPMIAAVMDAGTMRQEQTSSTGGAKEFWTTLDEVMAKPKLLSGGNPQIPKGEGDLPVQAYIAAIPGWKRPIGKQLDDLIGRVIPGVQKAR